MKPTLSHIIPLAGLLLAIPVLQAQTWTQSGQKKETKKEVHVIVGGEDEKGTGPKIERRMKFFGQGAGPQEMETVPYLGVMTRPMDETLAEQFGLQKNTGLIVVNVGDDTPAASALKRNDILLKFNDQILIDQRQLGVLVRNSKEGEEVTLTYIRTGKQGTVKVKLAQHEVPKMAFFDLPMQGPGDSNMHWFGGGMGRGAGREEADQLLGLIDLGKDGPPQLVRHNQIDGDRMVSITVNTGDSNMNFSDDKGSLELKIKDGKKDLVAKDPKGEVIFSGPINTPEERKGLPPEVAERLGKIENMHGFSFKTDGDFEGGETRVVRPPGQGISLPLPAAPRLAPRPNAF